MNPKKPLFSVVIPVYNKEAYIADTLTSVLKQTFTNFEILVVNDGSTDGSLHVVKTFTDPRITIFSKPNGGVSEARNKGIAIARGEYVAFLDADDIWNPEYLEEMSSFIGKYPACGLYAAAYKKIRLDTTETLGHELPEGIVEDFFKIKLLHLVPWTSTVVVRKSAFDEVGGFPVGMIGGEDDYTWAKISLRYHIAFTPKVLGAFNEAGSAIAFRMGKMDSCEESWFDFYKEGDFYRNELVARKAIYAGIRYAYSTCLKKSNEIERLTQYTVLSKKLWRDLYLLNRLPLNAFITLQAITSNCKRAKGWMKKFRSNVVNSLFQLW